MVYFITGSEVAISPASPRKSVIVALHNCSIREQIRLHEQCNVLMRVAGKYWVLTASDIMQMNSDISSVFVLLPDSAGHI